jgi:hypothetical protein
MIRRYFDSSPICHSLSWTDHHCSRYFWQTIPANCHTFNTITSTNNDFKDKDTARKSIFASEKVKNSNFQMIKRKNDKLTLEFDPQLKAVRMGFLIIIMMMRNPIP